MDPDNSKVISQTHLFDDKPKSDCQGDETSSFVNLDFSSVFNDSVDFNTDKYSDDSESFGSIKHKNSFCTSDRGDSEFPADSTGDSLPNVKGRLRERLPFWKEIGAGNSVTRILTLIWTGGGGQICPPSWFFEHSSETVRSRKLELSEFNFLFIRHLFN